MDVPQGPAVVVGQVGRDLVLEIDRLPRGGRSATVHRRRELLGGKGANQAVAMVQLGCPTALLGVLGDDAAGDLALAQAVADGLWISGIVRRRDVQTALLVDLVELGGPDDVREAAIELCSMGPQVVSLAAGEHGDLTVWREPGGRLR